MGTRAVLGLCILLLSQTGCVLEAGSHGLAVRWVPTLINRCGPRPSRQVVETLVHAELGNVSGMQLTCSTPVRRWVTDQAGAKVYGWHVTVALGPGLQKTSYIVFKRKYGFAIVAQANPLGLGSSPFQLSWQRRDLAAIDRRLALLHTQQELQERLAEQRRKIENQKQWILKQKELEVARELRRKEERERERRKRELERHLREQRRQTDHKLAERSRQWKVMTKRPTPEERRHADYGPSPKQARQAVRIHLANILKEAEEAGDSDIKIYEPSKTWGRVQGSGELRFGWSVRVQVRTKKKGERPQSRFFHFMFRGDRIVSTTREGLGYRLAARPGRHARPAKPGK